MQNSTQKIEKKFNAFFHSRKMLTIFDWNFEVWAVQKYANLVDLVKRISNEHLLAKIGVDTAENEPLKVCQKLSKR